VPRKALVGPWGHKYPNFAKPGPQIGFLQECLRWWDKWLKGIDTGVTQDPILTVWMNDTVAPKPYYEERPGRWVAETEWPSPRITPVRYPLGNGRLERPGAKEVERSLSISSPQTVGMTAGKWCPYGLDPDLPGDQRDEAGGSLLFDSAPLTRPLEILGAPEVELDITSDKPSALISGQPASPMGSSTSRIAKATRT
jgi:predicted acyl esterase